MEEYIGIIKFFVGDWEPENYMICDGRLLPINNYQALFSLIGTQFGGNGVTNFALPDFRGRVPVGSGAGPGLTARILGSRSGLETDVLTAAQLPAHSHTLNGISGGTETNTPLDHFLPEYTNTAVKFYAKKDKATDALLPLNAQSIAPAGQNQPISRMQPFLTANFIICVIGIYPTRQ